MIARRWYSGYIPNYVTCPFEDRNSRKKETSYPLLTLTMEYPDLLVGFKVHSWDVLFLHFSISRVPFVSPRTIPVFLFSITYLIRTFLDCSIKSHSSLPPSLLNAEQNNDLFFWYQNIEFSSVSASILVALWLFIFQLLCFVPLTGQAMEILKRI